jgi:1-acyl-sn-glycerol-3-phosphate acyltransferase
MPRALGRRWMLANPPIWARAILFVCGCPVVITRKAPVPEGGFLVFANHQSLLDVLAVFVAMEDTPVAFAAKRELFKIPFLGWYLSFAGFIEVDRKNRQRSMRAYDKACVLIRDEGVRVAIYPEGTRSIDGSVLPFKRGAFVLAIRSQAPIVPIAVEGAQKAARKHTLRLRGHPIHVVIGAPIPTAGLTDADRDALLVRTRTEILALHLEAGAEPSPVHPMTAKAGMPSGEREEA